MAVTAATAAAGAGFVTGGKRDSRLRPPRPAVTAWGPRRGARQFAYSLYVFA